VHGTEGCAGSDLESIPSDLIQTALEHLIASSAFDASPRNRAFLRFVVEETLARRSDRIKAYTIGTSVFGRDEAFDPQSDPIVRIEASRLRRSLERYYLIAGRDDPIRIDIPKGGYVASFQRLPSAREADGSRQDTAAPELAQADPPTLAGHRGKRRSRERSRTFWPSRRVLARGVAPGMAVLALVIGFVLRHEMTEPEAIVPKAAGGPSIIVLPFANLSGSPAKAYFAGGLTEEVFASLAQFKELFVFGHETGDRYGANTSYQELHRELGVRYVLRGSVREADGRIRVTARLTEAPTGLQLWAATYEGGGANLFRAQADIAQRVAVEVAQPYGIVANADMTRTRGKAPESLSAYECVLRVLDFYRHMTVARVVEARACLERATGSDPEYADAWALLGMSYLDHVRLRVASRSHDQDLLDRALRAAQRAVEIAPDGALAQRSLMLVHSFRREVEEAVAAGDRAVALNPNNAEVLAEFGMRLALIGQWDRGVSLIDEAIARNPAHPGWYHTAPAINFYRQGRYAEALERAKQIAAPGWVHHHTILAMIYGQLGQEEEARAAAREVLALDPNFEANAWYELQLRNFPEEVAEHMADGWRKAGLKIPAPPRVKTVQSSS
jgi:TolB-like protein/Tfp pilus assembly protein PilF